jgi:pimeloyl-ACP methyl ester carboxylesterase
MGAAIAGEVALAHPTRVNGLVLVAPAGYGPFTLRAARWPIVGRVGVLLLARPTVGSTLRSLYADPRRVSEADIDQYYAAVATPGYKAALQQVLRHFSFEALRGRLGALPAPTLVLWGPADRVIPFAAAAGLVQELPRSAFFTVGDAGHNVQEEQPVAVNRFLIDFLRNGLPAVPPDLAAGRSSAAAHSTASRTHDD